MSQRAVESFRREGFESPPRGLQRGRLPVDGHAIIDAIGVEATPGEPEVHAVHTESMGFNGGLW